MPSRWVLLYVLTMPCNPPLCPPVLRSVRKYPIVIPRYEWTLEFALPTPIPMHQFEQSPVVIEVKDRNPDPDALVYMVRRELPGLQLGYAGVIY